MKQLVVLATPFSAVNHVKGCSGALKPILQRGHRVIFVLEEEWQGTQTKLGFEEIIYKLEPKVKNEIQKMNAKIYGDFSTFEKLEQMISVFQSDVFYESLTNFNEAIKNAIEMVKPDVIYHDSLFLYPAIYYSNNIPWIRNISLTPLMVLFSDEVPPAFSGLPSKGDPQEYRKFNKLRRELFYSKKFNDYIENLDDRYPFDSICPESQALTVYAYPNELNYSYVKKFSWFNLEVFNKCTVKKNVDLCPAAIPNEFLANRFNGTFSGKIILVLLDSMGVVDKNMIARLLSTLGKTNHQYIVSKGPHNQLALEPNMVGGHYSDCHSQIFPLVDLVISGGCTITVTEAFCHGKPMIALPFIGDQFDNATRLQETGFGVQLHPYRFTEQEMMDALDSLLQNDELKVKLENASKRIQASHRHRELAIKIEDMFAYN